MKVNLLPREDRPLRQTEVRWEFLATLFGILLFGAVVIFSVLQFSKVQKLTKVHEEALQHEISLQRQLLVVNELKDELTSLEAKVEGYEKLVVTNKTSLVRINVLLNHTFPKLWIEAIDWTDGGAEIKGYTQNLTNLSLYINYLREHCEEAILVVLEPSEGTDFLTFHLQVWGVSGDVAA